MRQIIITVEENDTTDINMKFEPPLIQNDDEYNALPEDQKVEAYAQHDIATRVVQALKEVAE